MYASDLHLHVSPKPSQLPSAVLTQPQTGRASEWQRPFLLFQANHQMEHKSRLQNLLGNSELLSEKNSNLKFTVNLIWFIKTMWLVFNLFLQTSKQEWPA